MIIIINCNGSSSSKVKTCHLIGQFLFPLSPPPDVEPYACYHQSRDKTSGFYSIKLVLSQLCWEIMLHEETHHLSAGSENKGQLPSAFLTKRIHCMLHNNCTASTTVARVRRVIEIATIGYYILKLCNA